MSTLLVRFFDKVAVSTDGCWHWLGCRDEKGYGRIAVARSNRRAHRVAYELFVGPIPVGLTLDHLCRHKGCVNPDHLEPVTNAENIRRAAAQITHCPQGHAYSGDNLRVYQPRNPEHGPARKCIACHRESRRRPVVPTTP